MQRLRELSTIVLFSIFFCARAGEVTFENCGSTAYPVSINIQSCTKAPCVFYSGTKEVVSVMFEAATYSKSVTSDIYLYVLHVELYLTATPQPCEQSICPVSVDSNPYNYTAEIEIPAKTPPVNGQLFWRLKDDSGRSLVCYMVNVQIF